MGIGVGVILERKWLGFEAEGTISQKAVRFAVGAILLIGVFIGTREAVPPMGFGPLFRFGCYLIGLWISFVSPWIFLKLGLAKKGRLS